MISVLILTKNEATDLSGCIDSVSWCDDVHVLDAFSEDSTVAIAVAKGASVTQRKFEGFASQRNTGLQLPFKYDWILILDADERITKTEYDIFIQSIQSYGDHTSAFSIRRKDFFRDTWIKHSQLCSFYTRLLKKGSGQYFREINEVLQIEGPVKRIEGFIYHYPFSKGMQHWFHKHNMYSSMEAAQWLNESAVFSLNKALFSDSFTERRFHQKGLFYKLPFRPFIKWSYMMFVKLSFLDGTPGIFYTSLQTMYECMIILKYRQLKTKQADYSSFSNVYQRIPK